MQHNTRVRCLWFSWGSSVRGSPVLLKMEATHGHFAGKPGLSGVGMGLCSCIFRNGTYSLSTACAYSIPSSWCGHTQTSLAKTTHPKPPNPRPGLPKPTNPKIPIPPEPQDFSAHTFNAPKGYPGAVLMWAFTQKGLILQLSFAHFALRIGWFWFGQLGLRVRVYAFS